MNTKKLVKDLITSNTGDFRNAMHFQMYEDSFFENSLKAKKGIDTCGYCEYLERTIEEFGDKEEVYRRGFRELRNIVGYLFDDNTDTNA